MGRSMTWTIETDEESAARQRSGAIDGRYQVCHPVEGLVAWSDTLGDAITQADHYAQRTLPDGRPYCTTPFEVEVYDRMARRGQPQKWRRTDRRGVRSADSQCYVRSMKRGDKLSSDAWWSVVEYRGE